MLDERLRAWEQRKECACVKSKCVNTQKQTLWGGGALEVGNLCLVEDGSERSDALVSDVVVPETASEGRMETVRE